MDTLTAPARPIVVGTRCIRCNTWCTGALAVHGICDDCAEARQLP